MYRYPCVRYCATGAVRLVELVVIILRVTGEGVIFRQKRIGKNEYLLIFLNLPLCLDSPSTGTGEITLFNDERVLPMGKFLRKSKINELPAY